MEYNGVSIPQLSRTRFAEAPIMIKVKFNPKGFPLSIITRRSAVQNKHVKKRIVNLMEEYITKYSLEVDSGSCFELKQRSQAKSAALLGSSLKTDLGTYVPLSWTFP
jgi:hypothetical protein